jgi:hypothetical protein
MSTSVSPQRQLAARIRLAEEAFLKAEGHWLADHTPKQAAKLARRRDELNDLRAQHHELCRGGGYTVLGNWRV